LSNILYPVAWLTIIYIRNVAAELPRIRMLGILALGFTFTTHRVLGMGFEKIYERMPPRLWRQAYRTTLLVNSATWGGLNAILIWYYFLSWPAYLISFCSAGLAAGGLRALSTHLRLSRAFIMLMPRLMTLMLISAADSTVFDLLLYLLYFLFQMGLVDS
jgi:hypothetical protein